MKPADSWQEPCEQHLSFVSLQQTGSRSVLVLAASKVCSQQQAAYFILDLIAATPCSVFTLTATHPCRPVAQPGMLSIVSLSVKSAYLGWRRKGGGKVRARER